MQLIYCVDVMQEEALRKQAIDDQHIALSTIYIL